MSSLNIPDAALNQSSIFTIHSTGIYDKKNDHYLLPVVEIPIWIFLCWEYPRNYNILARMLLIFLHNVYVEKKFQIWSGH